MCDCAARCAPTRRPSLRSIASSNAAPPRPKSKTPTARCPGTCPPWRRARPDSSFPRTSGDSAALSLRASNFALPVVGRLPFDYHPPHFCKPTYVSPGIRAGQGAVMRRTRREFVVGSMAAVAGGMVGAGMNAATPPGAPATSPERGTPATGSAALVRTDPDHPQPAVFDRLDETWHRRAIARLQARLHDEGIDGALLGDRWNIIYFTGLWHTSTERPFFVFIPADGQEPTWFHPSLDRDLVGSWWIKDRETYFDFKHGEGAFPNLGKVQMGPTVDLTRWMLKGLRKRGWAGKVIGVDRPITADLLESTSDVLPKTTLKKAGDLCERLRMVKTPEEIALTQRTMNYFSRIHAFARDYLLTHGTEKTDFDVQTATTQYGVDLIMKDIKRDGKPHTAVGISVDIAVRTGVRTAYPHPNQFHHNRIRKGDALQA